MILKTGGSGMKYKPYLSKNEVFQHSYAVYCLNEVVLSSDETLVKCSYFLTSILHTLNGVLKACTSVCILFFKDVCYLKRLPEGIT